MRPRSACLLVEQHWGDLPLTHPASLLVRNLRFHVAVDVDKHADASIERCVMSAFAACLKHGALVNTARAYAEAAAPLPTAAELEGLTRVQVTRALLSLSLPPSPPPPLPTHTRTHTYPSQPTHTLPTSASLPSPQHPPHARLSFPTNTLSTPHPNQPPTPSALRPS